MKIIICLMGILLMTTFVSAEYTSWSDVIDDYFNLVYQTGNQYESATSMRQVINRIFEMKWQVLRPIPKPRSHGSSSPSPIPETISVQGDLNGDGKVNQLDLQILEKQGSFSQEELNQILSNIDGSTPTQEELNQVLS